MKKSIQSLELNLEVLAKDVKNAQKSLKNIKKKYTEGELIEFAYSVRDIFKGANDLKTLDWTLGHY